MKRVGFFAKARPPALSLVAMPNSHMFATTASTSGLAYSLAMAGCLQLVAPAGCSWRKCLPALTWRAYTAAAKTSKSSACRRRLSHSALPILLALRFS